MCVRLHGRRGVVCARRGLEVSSGGVERDRWWGSVARVGSAVPMCGGVVGGGAAAGCGSAFFVNLREGGELWCYTSQAEREEKS